MLLVFHPDASKDIRNSMMPYGGANSGAMNSFFGTQYTQKDLQQNLANRRGQGNSKDEGREPSKVGGGQTGMNHSLSSSQQVMELEDMMLGDSLDDIIMQNSHELRRRQSIPGHPNTDSGQTHEISASGMMKFGSDLHDFQFGDHNTHPSIQENRRRSIDHMDMMTGFESLSPNSGHPASQNFFSEVLMGNTLDVNSGTFPALSANAMGNILDLNPQAVEELDGHSIQASMFSSPYPRLHTNDMTTTATDFSTNSMSQEDIMRDVHARRVNIVTQSADLIAAMSTDQMNNLKSSFTQDDECDPYPGDELTSSDRPPTVSAPANNEQTISVAKREDFGNIYSTSGFDMLGILTKVVTRKNPEINIGAVDLSCAFVVCDVTQNDCPIIYVSDVFERLTGYNKHEILGRNCRFLQAPDGNVMPGAKRTYVDDESVIYIKKRVQRFREVQRVLLNYRKGGQPFLNLLTMVPVPWDKPDEIRYYVGFQVDLVEQPASITGKDISGVYDINYSRTTMPSYMIPEVRLAQEETGQTVSRDDVSAVLSSFNRDSNSDVKRRMWDKVLLENSDDVVHVLSLKGIFLYLSPSCRRILEYNASDLVGTALSSICHPSDIVPVTRELKDTSAGQPLNVVFRIRRKKSGYTWFESHGSLCVEQGKGRKFIVLVGRERPVYALSRLEIDNGGGICEAELWAKLSTSGMFLFVSSNVKSLLDRQSSDLIGTSVQELMRPESKIEFGRLLEKARTGKRVVFKHEVMAKVGRFLQASTTIYPGDASEGQKPTFLVAQTRLVKPFRTTQSPATRNAPQIPGNISPKSSRSSHSDSGRTDAVVTQPGSIALPIGTQDLALASRDNIFDELKTTRSTSWQFELRQMEKTNRLLAEELASLLASKKKRKRRRGTGLLQRDCANCHATSTPEWRRGPSGQRDLCNSCGLRWAKQNGKFSPRRSGRNSDGSHGRPNDSPSTSPLHADISATMPNPNILNTSNVPTAN